MKFMYVDESGNMEDTVFVMAGILIDAYKLRKWTQKIDEQFRSLRSEYDFVPNDFKTSKFINGKKKFNKIPSEERKDFISDLVNLIYESGCKIYAFALSVDNFRDVNRGNLPKKFPEALSDYWFASAIFISCLLQKKMQAEAKNKGLSVLIFDDNKQGMPKISNALYECNGFYDDLYSLSKK